MWHIELIRIAGKEARKKELKKNKKQRQLVRAAVLKGKDPAQIIEEMEKIDQMGWYKHYALMFAIQNIHNVYLHTSFVFF